MSLPTYARPENGCIYLGILNDYSSPFSQFDAGPRHEKVIYEFWADQNKKNELKGPSGAFSVALRLGGDMGYGLNPFQALEAYSALAPDVFALARMKSGFSSGLLLPMLETDSLLAASQQLTNSPPECRRNELLLSTWFDVFRKKETVTLGIAEFFGAPGVEETARRLEIPIAFRESKSPSDNIQLLRTPSESERDEYIPKAQNFTQGLVEKYRKNPVDVLYIDVFPPFLGHWITAIEKTAKEMNVNPPVYLVSNLIGPQFVYNSDLAVFAYGDITKEAASRIFFNEEPNSRFDADTPGHEEMRKVITSSKLFDDDPYFDPPSFELVEWQSQHALVTVLKTLLNSGLDVTRENLVKQVPGLEFSYKGMRSYTKMADDGIAAVGKKDYISIYTFNDQYHDSLVGNYLTKGVTCD